MRKILISLCSLLFFVDTYGQIEYPITKKKIVTDSYFDTKVEDPYRWLENDNCIQVKEWITAQNKLTFSYFQQIPQRESLKNRLEELWNYEKIGTPFKEG